MLVLGTAGSAALGLTLPITGLVAGASLSIDYVLTVAVSVAAGIAASPPISRPSTPTACPFAWWRCCW